MLNAILGHGTRLNGSNPNVSPRTPNSDITQQGPSSVKRVLIVDDESDHRLILRTVLEDKGYDCIEAVNGKMALDRLAEYLVDVVVSDLQMPKMDGIALLKAMSQDQRFGRVPVIVTTSRTLDQEFRLASAIKPYGVFTKPFQITKILGAVSCALEGSSPK